MLQVVGFLAMEAPATTYHESIRDEQVKVFRTIRPLSADDLVRGQFRGYRKEKGVAADSTVETFAAARLHIDSWRWDGVPFFIRAGKCLAATQRRRRSRGRAAGAPGGRRRCRRRWADGTARAADAAAPEGPRRRRGRHARVLPLVPRPDRDNGARVATSTDGIRPGEALRA